MAAAKPAQEATALLSRIMDTYRRAWETRDPALVVELFTEDATYCEGPFSAPIVGHDGIRRYWEEATRGQRDIRFRWQPVSSAGPMRVVEWEAEFTRRPTDRRVELRGVMILELRGERIFRFREYWLRRENN